MPDSAVAVGPVQAFHDQVQLILPPEV